MGKLKISREGRRSREQGAGEEKGKGKKELNKNVRGIGQNYRCDVCMTLLIRDKNTFRTDLPLITSR